MLPYMSHALHMHVGVGVCADRKHAGVECGREACRESSLTVRSGRKEPTVAIAALFTRAALRFSRMLQRAEGAKQTKGRRHAARKTHISMRAVLARA